jgi:hypothetical protein
LEKEKSPDFIFPLNHPGGLRPPPIFFCRKRRAFPKHAEKYIFKKEGVK